MNNYVSIRRQCEWERKKRAFWKYVWDLTVFLLAMSGVCYWSYRLVSWLEAIKP